MENVGVEFFDSAVCDELAFYVYRLIDPTTGETFYVGKGTGNRIWSHLREALSGTDPTGSEKHMRIREIMNAGYVVNHEIVRHGMNEAAAFEVEAALIDVLDPDSNKVRGHGAGRGKATSQEINDRYARPTIDWDPEHKLLLINVRRWNRDMATLYDQTRICWRVSQQRAEKVDYVLAMHQGVVYGAYVVHGWAVATRENFPEMNVDEPHRKAFWGNCAPDDIWNLYCGERGKRVDNKRLFNGTQNAIRYWLV